MAVVDKEVAVRLNETYYHIIEGKEDKQLIAFAYKKVLDFVQPALRKAKEIIAAQKISPFNVLLDPTTDFSEDIAKYESAAASPLTSGSTL